MIHAGREDAVDDELPEHLFGGEHQRMPTGLRGTDVLRVGRVTKQGVLPTLERFPMKPKLDSARPRKT